jgi:hypothetical protein
MILVIDASVAVKWFVDEPRLEKLSGLLLISRGDSSSAAYTPARTGI